MGRGNFNNNNNKPISNAPDASVTGPEARKRVARCKVYGCCAVSCAKTAQPMKMPFGIWTLVGPRKHVLCIRWECTLAPSDDHTEPYMWGGNAAYCQITWTTCYYLWSPYVIEQTIIFSSCFFLLSSSSSFFISSPNLSGRRLVYHTSTHGVALVRI